LGAASMVVGRLCDWHLSEDSYQLLRGLEVLVTHEPA